MATVWMHLDATVPREISRSQKDKHGTHTRNLKQPNSRKQRAERGWLGLGWWGTWGAAAQCV